MGQAAWMVRAGRNGEFVDQALTDGLAIVGWTDLPDLRTCGTRQELRSLLHSVFPDRTNYVIGNWTGQLWRFSHVIAPGDLVVLPKSQGYYAIGEVSGPYSYRQGARPSGQHVIPVAWQRTDVSRDEFAADLRNTLGSLLTVYGITRHGAPERIRAVAAGEPDPGWRPAAATADVDDAPESLWAKVASGDRVSLTIRELLGFWGYSRRTSVSEEVITSELDERGIVTKPPFTRGRIDSVVELIAVPPDPGAPEDRTVTADQDDPDDHHLTVRIRTVLPPGRTVETISSTASLVAATTAMLGAGLNQLPVLDGGHVRGW
ncbi:hypothetical protein ACFQV2_29725 [Actinokineospora soli]|uniref:Uncharacterized protein n=1 Tax=Actinokineospora soli TaxID=1048753 RepID=A0ABW2TT56_9PSEU